MSPDINRRSFIKKTVISSAAASLALQSTVPPVAAANTDDSSKVPSGTIKGLKVSRLMLGGNLLTHYTHSRDLKYVYNLAAHYNTEEKILQTLEIAESYGVNTLSIHTVPWSLDILRKHRKRGGKMQWIICPTAPVEDDMEKYRKGVEELANMGTDAIYLWGVHSDALISKGRVDLIKKAVDTAREFGIPSGVGSHDLRAVIECEKNNVDPDFYIKTFHHHQYPTGPKDGEIRGPYNEFPGYWCSDPKQTIEVMNKVNKPWIAFKVMAAGAIPPKDAFKYVLENGADHILAGMFDFDIPEDARIINELLPDIKRTRPWKS